LNVQYDEALSNFAFNFNLRRYNEVISTGGSFKACADAGVPVTAVDEITSFPEMLDGEEVI
jgi:AICAR transformylase/IMP cyclohydrolase PurH